MTCQFAPLTPRDQPAIVQHLLELESDDRVLRFNTTAPDNVIAGYCGRWDFARDIVEGARDGNLLVGVVHLPVFEAGKDLIAELGVSVAVGWRKHGIATELARRSFDKARSRGIDRVYINFLTRNRPMMCLARRFTDDIAFDGDETVATIRFRTAPEGPRNRAPAPSP
jgi:GNAT superfamily N-acetyltransferase